jgi:DNA-directed RNA polymerase specialized sigma24 family protein
LNTKQVNILFDRYFQTKSEWDFNDLYREVTKGLSAKAPKIARSIYADENTVYEIYHDAILRAIDVYKDGNFANLLSMIIAGKRKDVYRKRKRIVSNEIQLESFTDENGSITETAISMLPADVNVEEEIIAKEKADHNEVIDFLLRDANVQATAIVRTFLSKPKPTATAIAKDLGLHHSTVIRNLQSLAGNYNYKQFGDYRDYLYA